MTFAPPFQRVFQPTFDRRNVSTVANGLLNNLVAFWKLDETTGNRLDSSGNGYAMAPVSSPSYRAGKIGNAADIPNDSNYLTVNADALRLVAGNRMTVSVWFYCDSFSAAEGYPIGRWSVLGPGDWAVDVTNAGAGGFAVCHSSTSASTAFTPNSTIATGGWYHLVGWFDPAVGTYGTTYVCVNNGTVYSAAVAAAHTSAISFNTSIGKLGTNAYGDFDGAVDEVGIWNVILIAPQRTALYNGGTGITYGNFTL